MDGNDPTARPNSNAGQTIVIEKRERAGCIRALLLPLLVLSVLINVTLFRGESGMLPSPLSEQYVAGPIGLYHPKVAVVEVDGTISDSSVAHVLKQIRQAANDEAVKAVVLRIDSPGGTVSGSDQIWREIQSVLRPTKKPIVVSMGGMAASGGYYIAAAGDYLVAEPTTLTGSIGVILEMPQISGLLEKVGVDFETITTGHWKDSGSMYRPMSEEERQRWKTLIDDSYQRFVRIIAQGRKMKLPQALAVADGQVLTAQEALDKKLIDALGYFDDAVAQAATRSRVAKPQVVRYARPVNLRESLIGMTAPQQGRGALSLAKDDLMELRTPRLLMLAR